MTHFASKEKVPQFLRFVAESGQRVAVEPERQGESAGMVEGLPAEYVIDVDNHIVRTTFSGVVTCREVTDSAARLRDDLVFNPHFSELITFKENPDIQLGYLDWQSLADRDPFSSSSKRAFVVPSDSALYGLVRMRQLAEKNPINLRVFETEEEALSWLSMPSGLAQTEGR